MQVTKKQLSNFDQGTRGEMKLYDMCKTEHRNCDISGTAVWTKFPGHSLTHRIRDSS